MFLKNFKNKVKYLVFIHKKKKNKKNKTIQIIEIII